ncbi:MAG: DUF3800 domain-containing protein [Dehalococcoidia bacterium]
MHDTQIWNLVCAIQDAEPRFFGTRISNDREELKARRLLRRKTFRLAAQDPAIAEGERTQLAAAALRDGASATRAQLTALGQARVAYVRHVLELCAAHGVRFFASIVDPAAPTPAGQALRKDYAYLFERFFYFIDEQPTHERGLVVFDELERSRAHLLVNQMSAYFRATGKGRMRSGRIVPEPIFVHSDLTSGIGIADLVAYIISWNVRVRQMAAPRRAEMDALGDAVVNLRHRATIDRPGFPDGFVVWSFAVIDDLRPRDEREEILGDAG